MGILLEDCVKEHPDNYDAELLLRLYDLRRESKLRQGREWFIREFQASTVDDYLAQAPPGSEQSALFRMTVTYWDMAASLVNHGLIKEDLFFENTPELWIIWDKIRKFTPALREKNKNPIVWKNLETLAEKYEHWMAKRAPEALECLRQRLASSAPKKTS
jgi:hypothetical protein